jgi:hypothetical protein
LSENWFVSCIGLQDYLEQDLYLIYIHIPIVQQALSTLIAQQVFAYPSRISVWTLPILKEPRGIVVYLVKNGVEKDLPATT